MNTVFNSPIQSFVDEFYKENGPCCAGCDWWRYHNSLVGECIKSAPVSGKERVSMLGIENTSMTPNSGHIITKRNHLCGDFIDTYEW